MCDFDDDNDGISPAELGLFLAITDEMDEENKTRLEDGPLTPEDTLETDLDYLDKED